MLPCPAPPTYCPLNARSVELPAAGAGVGLGLGVGVGDGGGGGADTFVVKLMLPDPGTTSVIGLPLASSAWTVAEFTTVALRVSVIPTATVLPGATLPREHVMVVPAVHVPWLGVAERTVAVAVNASEITSCGIAVLPLFVTRIPYPASELASMELGPLSVIAMLAVAGGGGGPTGVTAFEAADSELFPAEFVA